jgi:hypothetical protein
MEGASIEMEASLARDDVASSSMNVTSTWKKGAPVDVYVRWIEMKGRFIEIRGGFVGMKGRFIEIGARSVETNGRFIEIGGRSVEMKGRFIEAKGRPIETKGAFHELRARSFRPRATSARPEDEAPLAGVAPSTVGAPSSSLHGQPHVFLEEFAGFAGAPSG